MTSPVQRYRADLEREGFVADPAQAEAVARLEDLHRRVVARAVERGRLLGRLRERFGAAGEPVRGLYLWGGVGRGKTYLMDTFYECLPAGLGLRLHFHRFMQRVHGELAGLDREKNPLESVAAGIAADARVLCFDEFFVTDIADAMILGTLLGALFRRGVALVATSNIQPAGLYENGLQRQRFLPAIALLERHCEVLRVDGGVDHRLRALTRAELYHCPLDDTATASLERSFRSLAPGAVTLDVTLTVNGRPLTARAEAEDVVWFDFATLCGSARSASDYVELAREYHAVVLGGVPVLDRGREDEARRFINLVDELYDRRVKLVLSAAAPPAELYRGSRLAFEFERTVSRLLEMQSHDYLAHAHRA